MTENKEDTQAKVEIFAIGLAVYRSQFLSFELCLSGYISYIQDRLSYWGSVSSRGMVDAIEKARVTGALFARQQVDIIFVYAATFATSFRVLHVLQQMHMPVLFLNPQPLLYWITKVLPLEKGSPIARYVAYLSVALIRSRITYVGIPRVLSVLL